MFLFAVVITSFSNQQDSNVHLPSKHQEFSDMFDKVKAKTLPNHRPYDCPIDLQSKKEPPWRSIYNLPPSELKVLREYIDENLTNGFIRDSQPPTSAPMFVVKNKYTLYVCS